MKKILILLSVIALIFTGCKNTEKITEEGTNKKTEIKVVQTETVELKFEKEVSEFKSNEDIEKINLSWKLEDKKDVEKIRVYKKQSVSKKYKLEKEFDITQESIEIKTPVFMEFDFCVKLVSKKDNIEIESNGVEVLKLKSRMKNVVLDKFGDREMQIYLPPGYNENTDKKYPVIYMHDGQNLFAKSTAPNGEWKVDETMDRLIKEGKIEEMIVVGIYNSSNRADEYTPYEYKEGIGGKAPEYAKFIVDNIVPYIDQNYRTIADRENRAVMGSSFGGILSFWMILNYDNVFSMAGAISPSYWVGDFKIFLEINEKEKKDIKIWSDVGTKEWGIGDRIVMNHLIKKGYTYGEDLVYYEVKDAEHHEDYWAERLEYPIIFFKGKKAEKIEDIEIVIQTAEDEGLKTTYNILNPIVKFDNGLKYSLYNLGEYSATGNVELNPATEVVLDNGEKVWFNFYGKINLNNEKETEFTVKYKEIEKKINFSIENNK